MENVIFCPDHQSSMKIDEFNETLKFTRRERASEKAVFSHAFKKLQALSASRTEACDAFLDFSWPIEAQPR